MAEEKAPLTEEQKMRRRAGRRIAFTVWKEGFKATNPDADKKARRAAWKEARKGNTKIGMRVLKDLRKSGYDITKMPAAEEATAE